MNVEYCGFLTAKDKGHFEFRECKQLKCSFKASFSVGYTVSHLEAHLVNYSNTSMG